MKNNSVRLSQHVKPTRYKITMRPDLTKFSFTGKVVISLAVAKPTKQLVLHAADLKVHYTVWEQGKSKIEATSITYQKKAETVTFTFPKNISGKGKLVTEFEGELNESLRGFYRSSYNHKGQQKHIATTQFEATDARRAFPNFDEPAHKAIFDVSLIVPEKLSAISNTLETSVSAHDPGYKL
jgi:aminopeptidase N